MKQNFIEQIYFIVFFFCCLVIQNCQGNSEGERCERCRAGYVLDPRSNQCVPTGQQPSGTGTVGVYVNNKPHDSSAGTPLNIVLDGSLPEQRIPVQVIVCDKFHIVF